MRLLDKNARSLDVWQVQLVVASVLSGTGDQIYLMALPWLMYDHTQSSFDMNTVRMSEFLGTVFLGLIAGYWVDRVGSKRAVLWAIPMVLLLISNYLWLRPDNAWHQALFLLTAALVTGVSRTFAIAWQSQLPQMYEKERLKVVNATLSMTASMVGLLGPALAGLMISTMGARNAIFINGLSFLFFLIPALTIKETHREQKKTKLRTAYREAWTIFVQQKLFMTLTFSASLVNLLFTSTGVINTYRARAELHFNAMEVSIMFSAFAVGGLIGGMLFRRLKEYTENAQVICISYALIAITVVILGLCDTIWGLSITIVIMMIAITFSNLIYTSMRQTLFPAEMLGKTVALTQTIMRIGIPLSYLMTGLAVDRFGARSVEIALGLLLLVYSLPAAMIILKLQADSHRPSLRG